MTTDVRLGYFGKPDEPLSLFGLQTALATPGLTVGSVTCTATDDEAPAGPLVELARSAGIAVLSHAEVQRQPPPDLVLSFSNSIIFREPFLSSVPLGVINMHPAPLPRFRGSDGIEHCLLEGVEAFGATLHYCDRRVDTGPVIVVETFPVLAEYNARDVWQQVDRAAERLLREQLPRVVAAGQAGRRVETVAQNQDGARFYPMDGLPAMAELDEGRPWSELLATVRAYDHPRRKPAYLKLADGRRLELGWRGGMLVVLDGERPLTASDQTDQKELSDG
jgi:methionyl-tRNA formyltransferase